VTVLVALGIPAWMGMAGTQSASAMSRGALAAMFSALALGSVLLFHFLQLFPWRRPWIQRRFWILRPLYVVSPLAAAGLVQAGPATPENLTVSNIAVMLVVGFPLLVLVGIVLPIGGILSLVKSYREAADGPYRAMRGPLLLLLVSQVAGGTIALLFAPVLGVLAPGSVAQTVLTMTAWLCGLLTPGAVALSVWRVGLPPIDSAGAAGTAAGRRA
jgi:hypothetical protein